MDRSAELSSSAICLPDSCVPPKFFQHPAPKPLLILTVPCLEQTA